MIEWFCAVVIIVFVLMLLRVNRKTDTSRTTIRLSAITDKDKIPIYYINMDKSTTRRQRMEGKLRHNEPYNKRIQAVVPEDLDRYEVTMGKCQSGGPALCCLLSHLKAVFTAYHDGASIALFLEDDVEIERWPVWSSLLMTAPKGWQMLRFFITSYDTLQIYGKAVNELWLENRYGWDGCVAHIINREGMERLLESCIPQFRLLRSFSQVSKVDLTEMGNTGAA